LRAVTVSRVRRPFTMRFTLAVSFRHPTVDRRLDGPFDEPAPGVADPVVLVPL
jgi:hypothetical protein